MEKDVEGKFSPDKVPSSKKVETEKGSKNARNVPPGILRLDIGRPRRLSAEFKFAQGPPGEPTSPQPSVDRLSVTFAEDSVKSDSSTKCNYVNFYTVGTTSKMEKVHFPQNTDGEDSDQEDYSASVNAIIQRRASTRRSRRRSGRRNSSPFTPDVLPGAENGRRRSSVYTTSSGDTAITMDENLNQEVTQEEIFENIKLHKEVLSNVKMQPWNMRKKLKLVVQAKAYIKKHEGALQERLAQSHSTKDMLARWNIYLIKKWQRWRREITNLSMWFIPWELKIKEIESHFGSVVASYFIFLRWLFWVNIVISIVIISFVTIPEILIHDTTDPIIRERKSLPPEEKYNGTNFLTLWDFEGVFKYSPLFYGWYMMRDPHKSGGYKVPTAYFVTGLMVYAYSFFATLRKMAENSRMSKLSEKDDECIFSWKLFTAWDYMIGNAETAHNRVASIVMGFKEALLEEAEKKRESRNWKIICFRVLVNTVVICLLSFSVFAVIVVVKRSTEPEANSTMWRRNEITVVMSLITLFFPMLFEVLGFLEQYHPRKQLRLQLARIMVLNLLNLYTLIFALFDKISYMTTLLQEYKNISETTATESSLSKTTVNAFTTPAVSTTVDAVFDNTGCYCTDSDISGLLQTTTTSLSNITTNFTSNFTNLVAYSNRKSNVTSGYTDKIDNLGTGRKLLSWNDTEEENIVNLIACSLLNVTDGYNTTNFTSNLLTNLVAYSFLKYKNLTDVTDYLKVGQKLLGWNDTMENNLTFFDPSLSGNLTKLVAYRLLKTINITGGYTDGTSYYDYGRKLTEWNETSEYDVNSSDVNITSFFQNYPFIHAENDSFYFNQTFNLNESNWLDVKDTFVDYLTYILSGFFENSTDYLDLNIFNRSGLFSNLSKNFSDFGFGNVMEETTTVVQQGFHVSEEERFDTGNSYEVTTGAYSTLVSSSAESPDLTTEFNNYCFDYCNSKRLRDTKATTIILPTSPVIPTLAMGMNYSQRAKLRSLCWETMFGQELIKLTVMDLILTIFTTLGMDFFRGIFVRVMNRCWCWDLEKTFPQYGDFKVAENILHLVNNQGMVWMGMFFSPGLVVLNVVKLYIMMYLRTWAVLTCNVPHEVIFRASRSNNFYYALLLMMLFLCVLPVGYAIVWITPSWHCGPFSGYQKIFRIFTEEIKRIVPEQMHKALDYIASPGIIIPLLVLLILIIYYLVSLTNALREANNDLKIQLRRERTEERRKMFQLADRRRRGGSGESNELSATPFTKWKKLIGNLPAGKSIDDTPRQESYDQPPPYKEEKNETKGKDFFSKLIKKALGKSSTSDEDPNAEDGTDNEQHDSLPYDTSRETRVAVHKPIKKSPSNTSQSGNDFNVLVHRVLSLKKTDSGADNSNNNHPQILLKRRDTLELKTTPKLKRNMVAEQPKTSASRQDSSASNWSDNIPVIKISKTESSENILDPKMNNINDKTVDDLKDDQTTAECSAVGEFKNFKPKIKCALKKQTTEIDEDTICHFEKDLQKIEAENQLIRALAQEDIDAVRLDSVEDDIPSVFSPGTFEPSVKIDPSGEYATESSLYILDDLSDRSTSEDTTEIKQSKSSDDTVLTSPFLVDEAKLNEDEIAKDENLEKHDVSVSNVSKESSSRESSAE